MMPIAFLTALLFAELTVPPGPYSRQDAIRTLAETHAVVLVASARCPDLFASTEINELQHALRLSDADSPDAYSLLLRMTHDMTAAADKVGPKAWCDEAYGQFGPDGTKMKGLLKRCDPGSSSC